MTIKDEELETLVEQTLQDERKRIYQGWIDITGIATPSLAIKRSWRKRKPMAIMGLDDWESYQSEVKEILQALFYASKRLEYLEQTRKEETSISFDEYIKKDVLDYDSAEFEHIRERFESQHMEQDGEEMIL